MSTRGFYVNSGNLCVTARYVNPPPEVTCGGAISASFVEPNPTRVCQRGLSAQWR